MNKFYRECVNELREYGYSDARDRVEDYIEYYATGRETKQEALLVMEDMRPCSDCGNYQTDEHLIDTEGMINGGIGEVCLTCKGDM